MVNVKEMSEFINYERKLMSVVPPFIGNHVIISMVLMTALKLYVPTVVLLFLSISKTVGY